VDKFRDGKNVIDDIKNGRRKRIRMKMRGEGSEYRKGGLEGREEY
jgi:hypothetical protein